MMLEALASPVHKQLVKDAHSMSDINQALGALETREEGIVSTESHLLKEAKITAPNDVIQSTDSVDLGEARDSPADWIRAVDEHVDGTRKQYTTPGSLSVQGNLRGEYEQLIRHYKRLVRKGQRGDTLKRARRSAEMVHNNAIAKLQQMMGDKKQHLKQSAEQLEQKVSADSRRLSAKRRQQSRHHRDVISMQTDLKESIRLQKQAVHQASSISQQAGAQLGKLANVHTAAVGDNQNLKFRLVREAGNLQRTSQRVRRAQMKGLTEADDALVDLRNAAEQLEKHEEGESEADADQMLGEAYQPTVQQLKSKLRRLKSQLKQVKRDSESEVNQVERAASKKDDADMNAVRKEQLNQWNLEAAKLHKEAAADHVLTKQLRQEGSSVADANVEIGDAAEGLHQSIMQEKSADKSLKQALLTDKNLVARDPSN